MDFFGHNCLVRGDCALCTSCIQVTNFCCLCTHVCVADCTSCVSWGATPYLAFLSLADAIVVTEDSVNMVTEATGTGKPVYIQPMSGRSARLSRFHVLMRERGATRPFEGHVDPFDYAPVNDTEAVAAPIRAALGLDSRG